MSKHTIVLDKKTGKPKSPAPRMAPVLAAAKHQQAAREEKAWKAKSKFDGVRINSPSCRSIAAKSRSKG